MKVRRRLCFTFEILGIISSLVFAVLTLTSRLWNSWEFLSFYLLSLLALLVFFGLSIYFGNSIICILGSILLYAFELGLELNNLYMIYGSPLLLGVLSLFNFKFYKRCNKSLNIWCFFVVILFCSAEIFHGNLDFVRLFVFMVAFVYMSYCMFKHHKISSKLKRYTKVYKARVTALTEYEISFIDKKGTIRKYNTNDMVQVYNRRYRVGDKVEACKQSVVF